MIKTDLGELAARVEAGSGEDRDLDAEAALACGWARRDSGQPDPIVGWEPYWRSPSGHRLSSNPPQLTSSLDAVVALIAERLPEWEVTFYFGIKDEPARAVMQHQTIGWLQGICKSPVRALLSATLFAIAAQQDRQTEG